MINLLPPQQKKELKQEQEYKLLLILGISVIVFLVALSLMLFTVKIYISGKVQSNKIITAAIPQDQEREVAEINKNFKNLNLFYARSPHSAEFFEKISKILPANTSLTSISLNFSQKEDNFPVSLQGFSPTRELLLQLKKNLDSEASFKDINFPVSNLLKPENIEFSVSFKAEI